MFRQHTHSYRPVALAVGASMRLAGYRGKRRLTICQTVEAVKTMVDTTWATSQPWLVSDVPPCPATWSLMPVMMVASKSKGNSSSTLALLFILWRGVGALVPASATDNAPCGHALTHFLHPMQASASWKTACLCHRMLTLPITCLGHCPTHCQQATQRLVLSATYLVECLIMSVYGFSGGKGKYSGRKHG